MLKSSKHQNASLSSSSSIMHYTLWHVFFFKREIIRADGFVWMIARSPHAHKAPPIIPSATEALLSEKSTQKGYLCKLLKFTQSKLNVLQYIAINKNKTSTKRRADRYRTSVYRMFVCIYSGIQMVCVIALECLTLGRRGRIESLHSRFSFVSSGTWTCWTASSFQ